MAFTVLDGICSYRATPELMELTARLGSMLPYCKAAELLPEFLRTGPRHPVYGRRRLPFQLEERLQLEEQPTNRRSGDGRAP